MFATKHYKKMVLLLTDVVIILISYAFAALLRFDFNVPDIFRRTILEKLPVILFLYVLIFTLFRLYTSLWQVAGLEEYLNVVVANVLAAGGAVVYGLSFGSRAPVSIILIASTLIVLFTFGFRIFFRVYRRLSLRTIPRWDDRSKNILLIGAGDAAALIMKEVRHHRNIRLNIVGLVDDDPSKMHTRVGGEKVLGTTEDIPRIVESYQVDEIILAIPSISNKDKKRILEIAQHTSARMKTVPGVYELVSSEFNYSKIRDVDVTDLLGRKEISWNTKGLSSYIKGKRVLITGGGGSIGSEICRQIAGLLPERLVIVDIYENNAYDLEMELHRHFPDLDLIVRIASVRDRNKIEWIFREERPEVVFHAAAHKHVPLMETSPDEAVKNNVFGTLNMTELSAAYGVEKFIMISTDKAVNPTNVMGATKRLCEMIVQTLNEESKGTEFVAVRFGNVLGSSGSVLPLFKRQIEEGGPVTLTHQDITRYFMTIPEAVQLVLQAGAFAKGGEIFVLDMGDPVRIYDLAVNLIRLSGLKPDVDIHIEITGLRQGEKLYEELLTAEEGLERTENDLIFIGKPSSFDKKELRRQLEMLQGIVLDTKATSEQVKDKLGEIVTTYKKQV